MGDLEPRLVAVESFVAGRREAENAAAALLKAEVENLRAQLAEERDRRTQAERVSSAVSRRLLELGVDLDAVRSASDTDKETLRVYAEALTQLLIPDPDSG